MHMVVALIPILFFILKDNVDQCLLQDNTKIITFQIKNLFISYSLSQSTVVVCPPEILRAFQILGWVSVSYNADLSDTCLCVRGVVMIYDRRILE